VPAELLFEGWRPGQLEAEAVVELNHARTSRTRGQLRVLVQEFAAGLDTVTARLPACRRPRPCGRVTEGSPPMANANALQKPLTPSAELIGPDELIWRAAAAKGATGSSIGDVGPFWAKGARRWSGLGRLS
jgi:hypothetical protein